MNKRGSAIGVLIIVLLLFFAMVFALAFSVTSAVGSWAGDEITPIMQDIGIVDSSTNISEYVEMSVVPVNQVVQNFQWMIGVIYFVALIGVLGMAFMFRGAPNAIAIGFFFVLVIVLLMGSILVSNTYQDLYEANDDVGTRLQEQTIMSYLLLYSPVIITIISFIAGGILFSGREEEQYQ